MKVPYLKFYVGDWLGDTELNLCSLAAQGLMVKLMCYMHKSPVYGKLLLEQNGKQNPIKKENLARLVGLSVEEFLPIFDELLSTGVIKFDDETGCFYSKRMVDDGQISAIRAASGGKGGKKTASKFAKAKPQAKVVAKQEAKAKQNPEYEFEYEYEHENEIKKEKEEKSKEQKAVIFPFNSPAFILAWARWIEYRKSTRNAYKSVMSEQAALKQLSQFDEEFSIKLIENSIANGYKGLVFGSTADDFQKYKSQNQRIQNGKFTADNVASGFAKIDAMFANRK